MLRASGPPPAEPIEPVEVSTEPFGATRGVAGKLKLRRSTNLLAKVLKKHEKKSSLPSAKGAASDGDLPDEYYGDG